MEEHRLAEGRTGAAPRRCRLAVAMQRRGVRRLPGSTPLFVFLPGCATLQGILALREVEFVLDRVHEVRLAGVLLDRIDRPEAVSALDLARIVGAVAQGTLPLALRLDIGAMNPEGNPEARLAALDWTFFVQDRETVRGGLPAPVRIPVAGRATIPLELQLDLLDFVDGNAQDLLNLVSLRAASTPRATRGARSRPPEARCTAPRRAGRSWVRCSRAPESRPPRPEPP